MRPAKTQTRELTSSANDKGKQECVGEDMVSPQIGDVISKALFAS